MRALREPPPAARAWAAVALAAVVAAAPSAVARLTPGDRPSFEALKTLSGKRFTPGALKGRIVVVHFWSVSNAASVKQISDLKEVYGEYRKKGLAMLGINRDRDPERARSFAEKVGMSWPQVHEPAQPVSLSDRWGVGTPPDVFVFSSDAKLLWRGNASLLASQIRRVVDSEEATKPATQPSKGLSPAERRKRADRAAALLEKAKAALEKSPPDLEAMRRYIHKALEETDQPGLRAASSNEYRERRAKRRLLLADQYRKQGSRSAAIDLYREIIEQSPNTEAAVRASQRLREMNADQR